MQQLSVHRLVDTFLPDKSIGLGLDTLHLARKSIQQNRTAGVPVAYNLAALHQYVTGNPPSVSHRAMADVKATIAVFFYQIFWQNRGKFLFSFRQQDEMEAAIVEVLGHVPTSEATRGDDSDTSVSDNSNSTDTSDGDTTDDDDSIAPAGDRWEENSEFRPSCPLPLQQFNEHFTSSGRSRRQRTGLQCSPISVNTPIRAWREVFKNTLLDKIVRYTNDYGKVKAKRWQDVDRKDLEGFICVLFVSAIQKRKDKPSNWFSENRLLESPLIKKIMSGRKFFTMLRYLHCCSMDNVPVGDDYDPTYKVKEIKDYLEDRYNQLFIPGQQLSLDETLIRAFGRIKFKVRIVTKAARYGIKLYVITDAVTAFVLKVVIYTGKSTYISSDQQEKKKTVQVVEQLVEPFVGTYRTIYVDRFYTSIDLLKSLTDRQLFLTGTVLANRIPLSIRTAKTSSTFKKMNRGDAIKCRLKYTTQKGATSHAGLVCWRDRNMVYCLSNDTNNFEFDECSRRGIGGIIRIPRPLSIANYNKYMGGVDLADMRRLHCNSTIMCQNRWWLKLFFYLLDVGTSNALVLFNESAKMLKKNDESYTPMNIVDFKMQLVEGLVGRLIYSQSGQEEVVEHVPIKMQGEVRSRCAYCALLSRTRRTRYKCSGCGVPLCSIGSGKVDDDCFALAHETVERRELVCKKFVAMQKRTTIKNKL
jgi:Transposase IS4